MLAGYQIAHWLCGANLLVAEQRPDAVAGTCRPLPLRVPLSLRVTDPNGDNGASACQPYTGPVDITLNKSGQMTQRFGIDPAGFNGAFAPPTPKPIITK